MFVTNWISTTKIQKISEITNFFRHYFLSRTEVVSPTDAGRHIYLSLRFLWCHSGRTSEKRKEEMDRSACILAHDYANYADSRFGRGNGTLDILRPGSPPVHLIRFLALLQNPKFHRYICGLSHIQYGSVQPGQQLGYHPSMHPGTGYDGLWILSSQEEYRTIADTRG